MEIVAVLVYDYDASREFRGFTVYRRRLSANDGFETSPLILRFREFSLFCCGDPHKTVVTKVCLIVYASLNVEGLRKTYIQFSFI